MLIRKKNKRKKKSEENLKANSIKKGDAKAELRKALSRLKSQQEFITITSHELKAPVAAIRGFSQLMIEHPGMPAEEKDNYISIISRENGRLGRIVSDIIDISKLDLKAIKFYFERIKVKDVAEELKPEFEFRAKEQGLQVRWDIEESLPEVVADKVRLMQVLTNLFNNAVNYTEKGFITIKAAREKKHVLFSVTDTGKGIAKKDFKLLFRRFSQIDSAITRKIGGTGLGLAISRELVERMRGKIWAKSSKGEGTTFYFTIPAGRNVNK